MKLNVGTVIVLWLAVTIGASVMMMPPTNRCNWWSISLLFFNYLNMFISFCEICLGRYISLIQADYKELREKYKGKELDACVAFLTMRLTIWDMFDGRVWSKMWSTYALYDPSYQNNESFGFFIDVGNGWTTILPTVFVNIAIVNPVILESLFTDPHIVVGCLGIASYWQMMYGTYIYFLSYFFNKRHEGKSFWEVAGFVGISNAIWVIFPGIGLSMSYTILSNGNLNTLSL